MLFAPMELVSYSLSGFKGMQVIIHMEIDPCLSYSLSGFKGMQDTMNFPRADLIVVQP